MPMWLSIAMFGAFGGAAPTLVKLAAELNAGQTLSIVGSFLVAGLIYAVLGAVVASAFGEQSSKGALFAGIAAPAIIANAISVSPAPGNPQSTASSRPQASISYLVPQAQARELNGNVAAKPNLADTNFPISAATASDTGKTITIKGAAERFLSLNLDVCFLPRAETNSPSSASGADSNCLKSENITAKSGSTQTLYAPPDAAAVSIAGKTFRLDEPISNVEVPVQTHPTRWQDIWWALGGKQVPAESSVAVTIPSNGVATDKVQ